MLEKRIKICDDELRRQNLVKWRALWLQNDKYLAFQKIFENNYEYAKEKRIKNKKRNFMVKQAYLILVIVGLLLSIHIGCKMYRHLEGELSGALLIGGVCIIVTLISASCISRILCTYKYQETWARHSKQQYLMDREILLFIEEISPYNNGDKKKIFIRRSLQIWDKNIDKFINNMENKEVKTINEQDVLDMWLNGQRS